MIYTAEWLCMDVLNEATVVYGKSIIYFVGSLASETHRLFTDLLSGQTGDPRSVKNAVTKFSGLFRGTAQEDAQEFLRWYLEGNSLIEERFSNDF